MYYVYVLYSEGFQKYYVGVTKDLERRIYEHNKGRTKSTKPFVPWALAHKEKFATFEEARKRETYLKSAAGRRWRREYVRPRSSTG